MNGSFLATALTFLLLLVISCKSEKEKVDHGKYIGSLHVENPEPMPGDRISVFYQPEVPVEQEGDLESFYHYTVNDKAYPVDLALKDSLNGWRGEIVIPDSATAIVFHFKINDEFKDNNKKGFVLPIFDRGGNPLNGSNAAIGYFYLKHGEQYEMEMTRDSVLVLIEKDLELYQSLLPKWEKPYREILYENNNEKGKQYFDNKIALLENKEKLNADENGTLAEMYGWSGRTKKADSLRALVAEKYNRLGEAKKYNCEGNLLDWRGGDPDLKWSEEKLYGREYIYENNVVVPRDQIIILCDHFRSNKNLLESFPTRLKISFIFFNSAIV